MSSAVRIAEGHVAAGYAEPDAAPWLLTVVVSAGLVRDKTSVGIKAIDWIRVSPAIRTPGKRD